MFSRSLDQMELAMRRFTLQTIAGGSGLVRRSVSQHSGHSQLTAPSVRCFFVLLK